MCPHVILLAFSSAEVADKAFKAMNQYESTPDTIIDNIDTWKLVSFVSGIKDLDTLQQSQNSLPQNAAKTILVGVENGEFSVLQDTGEFRSFLGLDLFAES